MSENIKQNVDGKPEDWEYGPMTDEDLAMLSNEAFLRMDEEEAADVARRNER